jgi:hypothetical protein
MVFRQPPGHPRDTREATHMSLDLWTYEIVLPETVDLEGFDVEATDGSIGKVDEATFDAGSSYIVVDTGPWIFGKKVLLPATAIMRVDVDARNVYVRLTKDQIKNSPEFDESTYASPEYRNRVGSYYGAMV